MPNYSLVANATFQPFTYQELMAPIERQNIYHEKLNEEYDKLSSQADVLEVLGASDLDKSSGSYGRYKAYSDALREEADNLYRLGLNSESRQRLSDLRRRYNTDIVPIQNAWNKREEETKMQLSASMQNPSLMFTRDASKTSLDDYIANPMGGFATINGANITAQMATMASNLAKQIRGGHTENIDDYTVRYITKFGLDENFIRNWRNSPTLSRMFEQVMQSNGVTPEALQGSLNAQSIIDKSTSYAEMGMWNAMGEDKSEIRENFINRLNAQQAAELNTYRRKKEIDAEYTNPSTPNVGLPGDTYSINFSDPESAGNDMKMRLANATAAFMKKNANNPNVKKIMNFWKDKGGLDAAVQYWAENGFNGHKKWTGEGKDNIYYSLGNYLRENVTKNEGIINIWRSPYETGSGGVRRVPVTSRDAFGNVYHNYDYVGSSSQPAKNWKNINDLSNNGYHVNALALRDDATAFKNYIEPVIIRNTRNGKVNLYDIDKISGNGTYTYSKEKMSTSKLPMTNNGKEIDYSQIHRSMLSNGDYLLYWIDANGNRVEKVLKRSDISEESVRDWNNVSTAVKSAYNWFLNGKMSREEFDDILSRSGNTNIFNAYLDTQGVDVQPYKIQ